MSQPEINVRVIAFYLPQFHPIPENDAWWGKGFTEWTNLTKARPMFRDHYQPHIPADLGYYDLRVPETRVAQAEMAREYGIEAFCYYHYWFAGKRLLERPFNEVLESGEPDFPFCLCWANQSWTGVWHGLPDRVLIEQTYPGYEDYINHFCFLLRAFKDKRYLTVDGKPILFIFMPTEIPDVREVTELWRRKALQAGFPGLHLVAMNVFPNWVPQEFGFDASLNSRFPELRRQVLLSKRHILKRIRLRYQELRARPTIYSYEKILPYLMWDPVPGIDSYPCVMPNWDNTPRSRADGLVLHGSTPELFRKQLRKAIYMVSEMPRERQLVLIKSWNEWAEGNHLEPDLRYGRGNLQVIKEEFANSEIKTCGQVFLNTCGSAQTGKNLDHE